MIFAQLISDPLFALVWIFAVIYALTIHEFAHGAVAYALGDSTAKDAGRLTLNPLSHIDILGFLMLLFVGFGWSKPVPFNPRYLKFPRFGEAMVAAAGPFSNLLSVILFVVILRFLAPTLGEENLLANFLFWLVVLNTILFLFNLLPIPPLDGSKVLFDFLPPSVARYRIPLELHGPTILIGLVILDSLLRAGGGGSIFGALFNGIIATVVRLTGVS